MGDVLDFKKRTFEVGDRVAFDNINGYDYGTVTFKDGDYYEVEWDDGFVDEEGYNIDELRRLEDVVC